MDRGYWLLVKMQIVIDNYIIKYLVDTTAHCTLFWCRELALVLVVECTFLSAVNSVLYRQQI